MATPVNLAPGWPRSQPLNLARGLQIGPMATPHLIYTNLTPGRIVVITNMILSAHESGTSNDTAYLATTGDNIVLSLETGIGNFDSKAWVGEICLHLNDWVGIRVSSGTDAFNYELTCYVTPELFPPSDL